ncbi:MAG: LysM peptidoglycan-binding domain-containing protein [bacterium]
MNQLEDIGTTEAIDVESMEQGDYYAQGYNGSCPTCSPATAGEAYYSMAPAYYSSFYDPLQANGYNWYLPTYTAGNYFYLPGEISQIPPPPQVCTGFYYTIQRGETLWILSHRFGISINTILRANPQIIDPNLIYTGQIICIPFPPAPRPCSGFLYTIQPGDSLYFIAQRFGISLRALMRANPQIINPHIIYPGQVICIPVPSPPTVCRGFLYEVETGDTIARIARRFGVRHQAILDANPQIVDPNLIFPGQMICIPFPPPPECPEGFLYTIQRGETLLAIARRYNLTVNQLLAANPQIVDPDIIFVGQVICIPRSPGAAELD